MNTIMRSARKNGQYWLTVLLLIYVLALSEPIPAPRPLYIAGTARIQKAIE